MQKPDLAKIVEESFSYSDVLRALEWPLNGKTTKQVKDRIKKAGLGTSHFDPSHRNRLRKKERAITSHCEHPECGKEHDGSYGSGKFCSSKCARSYSTYLNREETNAKVSASLTGRPSPLRGAEFDTKKGIVTKIGRERMISVVRICPNCQSSFTIKSPTHKFCSKKCVNDAMVAIIRESIVNGTHKGWAPRTKLSFAEKYYKDQLDANGYTGKYIVNHPISQMDLGMDRPYCYYIDFYFPESKLCVEIDGKQHNIPERVESDRTRDHYLKQSGYTVYRIPWLHLKTKPAIERTEENVSELLEFLNAFQ